MSVCMCMYVWSRTGSFNVSVCGPSSAVITAEEGPRTKTFCNPVKLMLCYRLNTLPVHVYVCVCMCVCVCVRACVYVCVCVHARMYVRMYTFGYKLIHACTSRWMHTAMNKYNHPPTPPSIYVHTYSTYLFQCQHQSTSRTSPGIVQTQWRYLQQSLPQTTQCRRLPCSLHTPDLEPCRAGGSWDTAWMRGLQCQPCQLHPQMTPLHPGLDDTLQSMQNTERTTVLYIHMYRQYVEYKACYCNKDNCSMQQRAVSYVWSFKCYSYQCSDRCFRQSCPPLAVCWGLGCSGGSYIRTYIQTQQLIWRTCEWVQPLGTAIKDSTHVYMYVCIL